MKTVNPSKICFLGCYEFVLNKYGLNITEEDIYANTCGFTFLYRYIHQSTYSNSFFSKDDFPCIEGSNHLETDKIKQYGVDIYKKRMNRSKAVKFCIDVLEQGNLILAYCDPYYIYYHPCYQKIHSSIMIIITGYNTETTSFEILDRHVPTFPISVFSGYISSDDLCCTFISDDELAKSASITLLGSRRLESISDINHQQNLLVVCQRMLTNDNCCEGIAAIRTMKDDIVLWDCYWDSDRIREIMRFGYLYMKNRGGPIPSRMLYFKHLKTNFPTYYNVEIQNTMESIEKSWSKLATMFFRMSIQYKQKMQLIPFAEELSKVADEEEKLFLYYYNKSMENKIEESI